MTGAHGSEAGILGRIADSAKADTGAPDDWLAAYVDAIMSDYGVSLHEAVWKFPLVAAHYLAPARVRRHGGKWEAPDSSDRAIAAARARAKAWLAKHFRILPKGEPGPADALGDWMRSRALRGEGRPGES